MDNLIQKYNIPGPRYTSYPTVPYWDNDSFSKKRWIETLQRSFDESNNEGISLYIHLPFCESLCTFCACNKRITKQHSVEIPYIENVLKEWKLYIDLLSSRPKIKEIHLGGGTPTFFSPENLKKLIEGIFKYADVAVNGHEFSLEGHPNNTTKEHLEILYNLGFRRISYGVQDYDPKIQKAINRVQSFENVKKATEDAREIGFSSVSHDLIFGLPHQTKEIIINSINLTNLLSPDRISFYSYAHVPWIKGVGQRGFNDKDLPTPEVKRELYEEGKKLLEKMGYFEIGMDHFALKHDSMYQSLKTRKLHRNFMGYSSSKTQLMIGLGVSSISDSWYSFAQNEKTLEEYQKSINSGELSVFKGHILSKEDLVMRRHILNLMCNLETSWNHDYEKIDNLDKIKIKLESMIDDNLILFSDSGIKVNEKGRPYIRNVCMAFDKRMMDKEPETRIFSMTI